MTNEERKAALEAIIYAADEPATIDQLATALGDEKLAVQSSLDELVASYASEDNTLNLIQFFEACPSRHAMIVAFLAVLEMVKLQAVALVQEKQFGAILLRKHKMFDVVFDEQGGIRQIDEQYQ